MRNLETLSKLTDELDQHLTQVSALIDFMSVDYCNNGNEFTANAEIVGNLLWTAQTLLDQAKKSADQLYHFNRQAYLQESKAQQAFKAGTQQKLAHIEQERLAQTTKGGNDD
ncbi:hypothetical protein F544_20670 [Bibersteinia trehalosi USDA-ARS-USMARC-190]|uniref:Uncharacterized protein n=1 Tax=Bibersteinia trehalosi USDA-ARS-USMARC-190 TaxID=1263832 RepID=W0RAG1_BIBTR|nr:hypothetical protein [Bibersteinia trehalosi]AHG87295.1 hypothetical protein F544_20670 [Bibersteinia trehalosi USDA-ARS-USMARC-190]